MSANISFVTFSNIFIFNYGEEQEEQMCLREMKIHQYTNINVKEK